MISKEGIDEYCLDLLQKREIVARVLQGADRPEFILPRLDTKIKELTVLGSDEALHREELS